MIKNSKKPVGPRIPTESEEQQCLFRWAQFIRKKYPEMDMLYHIPNGGKRGKAEAGRFQAEGVKAGVPDICLPVARGIYHGMYIELKRREKYKTSDNQKDWLEKLKIQGYFAVVCKGWEVAKDALEYYMRLGENTNGRK